MNPVSQPDLHPDADLLNAFVEHALPDAERARVVTHMAACTRCREIVFLAQAAAEPEIAPAPAVIAEPRPRWFALGTRKWSLALIPAGAIAALAVVTLWVGRHPRTVPVEMAQLAPQAASTLAPAPPAQTSPPVAEANAARQPSGFSASSAKRAAAPGPVTAAETNNGKLSIDRLPSNDTAVSIQWEAKPENQKSRAGNLTFEARSDPLAPPPQPALAPPVGSSAAQRGRDQQQLTRQPGAPPRVAASSQVIPAPPGSHTVAVSSAAIPMPGGLSAAPVPPSQTAELTPQSVQGISVASLAKRMQLPSGLNVVSSAALLNRLVAIDSAGEVFLSQDGGKQWDSVKGQWSGKPIQVQAHAQAHFALMRSSANAKAADKTTPDAAPSPNPPAPDANGPQAAYDAATPKAEPPVFPIQFKLLTDKRQVWLSMDGKVWHPQ